MKTVDLARHPARLLRTLRRSRRAILAAVAVACTLCATALAVAQSPAPTATYSAPPATAAAGTGTAGAGDKPPGPKAGLAVSAYAWPTEASPEPKEDEWAGATVLETLDKTVKDKPWWRRETLTCTQRAVREWMRITCTPASEFTSYGVVWGAAGDLSTAKAKLPLRRDMPGYKPPENAFETMTPAMAVSATLTFQVKVGSATVLQVDEIEFVSDWGWAGVVARPGFIVDVSWAAGEKAPWIEVR